MTYRTGLWAFIWMFPIQLLCILGAHDIKAVGEFAVTMLVRKFVQDSFESSMERSLVAYINTGVA